MITYIAHIETCHQKCDIIVKSDTIEDATYELTNAIASAKTAIESQYNAIMQSKKEEKKEEKKSKKKDITEYNQDTATATDPVPPTQKQMELLQRCGVHPDRLRCVFSSTQASKIISRIKGNPQTGQTAEPEYARELRSEILYNRPLDEWLIEIF